MGSARYEIVNTSASANTERFGYEEIKLLLDLCEKNGIISQSQTKGYSLVKAFTPIHKEMLSAGYNRSLTQVIDKFRKLKLRFAHAYLARKRGKTAMSNRFEHYKRFEKMLDTANIDIFIKKFSKKNFKDENNSDDNSLYYDNLKDDSNSRNILDYENTEDFETIQTIDEDDHDIIEKEEVLLDEEFQNDDLEGYSTENVDIKFLGPSTSSPKSFSNNTGSKNVSPSERTVLLLEQLVPNFKKAQLELQQQFFRQQKELQRQQQEWEERILDEEREYLTKVLSTLSNLSNRD